jgi:uncharacterized coiled-coil protein SlyX
MAMTLFTFRYKQEPDSEGIPRLGIFVEEAEENPDLLTRDPKVKPCTVRYDAVIAMLINESLKERRAVAELNRKIQERDVTITQLKKQMEIVVTFLKEQYSKIQRVGTELESSRCAPQSVVKFVARPAATLIEKIGDRPG